MKIQRFLEAMLRYVQLEPDINLKTLKQIISMFKATLSKKEKERWSLSINLILSYNNKQESIPENFKRIIKQYVNEA
jgi:hypothetical protein